MDIHFLIKLFLVLLLIFQVIIFIILGRKEGKLERAITGDIEKEMEQMKSIKAKYRILIMTFVLNIIAISQVDIFVKTFPFGLIVVLIAFPLLWFLYVKDI